MMARGHTRIAWLVLGLCVISLEAQVGEVRGRVEVEAGAKGSRRSVPSAVVWLKAVNGTAGDLASAAPKAVTGLRLTQRNKNFEPHVLVVPAGSAVEFPNRDPFFHNVFSLFEGKRFDLGLYEAGSSRVVHFDRAGISYIFCNIHPEMSAIVITLDTPFFAVANREGHLSIPNVPYGRYMLHVWSEGAGIENTQPVAREITIGESAMSLGVIRVPAVNRENMAHKNKYGRDYDDPTPENPAYGQQR